MQDNTTLTTSIMVDLRGSSMEYIGNCRTTCGSWASFGPFSYDIIPAAQLTRVVCGQIVINNIFPEED